MALQGKYGLIVLVAALFAGAAIGFASTSLAYRLHWIEAPGENVIDRMCDELTLSPSQREQVGEVMRGTHERISALRVDFQHQRRRLLLDAYLRIYAILSPGQRARFDDEFVPPRFREEARRIGREFGAPGDAPPSVASGPAAGNSPPVNGSDTPTIPIPTPAP